MKTTLFSLFLSSWFSSALVASNIIAPQLSTTVVPGSIVEDFTVTTTEMDKVIAPVTTNAHQIIYDAVWDYYTTGTNEVDWRISLTNIVSSSTTPTFTSLNTNIAAVDADGNVNFVEDESLLLGVTYTAYVNVTLGKRTKQLSCPVSRYPVSPPEVFDYWVPGSLAAYLKAQVDDRISGLTPTNTTYDMYSYKDNSTRTYVRNTSLWVRDVDLTCIPATWSEPPGFKSPRFSDGIGCGILVAPDVMINAHHCARDVGSLIYFVQNDNTVVAGTITGTQRIGSTDLEVVKLDSNLPSTITPAKVFSYNVFCGAAGTRSIYTPCKSLFIDGIPIISYMQSMTLRVNVTTYNSAIICGDFMYAWSQASGPPYHDWGLVAVSGDSGHPLFTIVDGSVVALCTYYLSTSAPPISDYIPEINAAMIALGSTNQLTQVDVSRFPTY